MIDLMKPRVIVTEYYPDSPFQVGDVLYKSYAQSWLTNEAHEVYTLDETLLNALKATDVEKATTCFRSLAWHEHRNIEDMPQYVKYKDMVGIVTVHFMDGISWCRFKNEVRAYESPYQYITPATEQEYTDFVNSKNQPK